MMHLNYSKTGYSISTIDKAIFFLELIKFTLYLHPHLIALDTAHYLNEPNVTAALQELWK